MTTIFRQARNTSAGRKILLHGCPRCRGDLFHDDYEDEFVCLQCGRRADPTMIVAQVEPQLVTQKAA